MSGDLISRKAFLRHVENQHRQWGNDYDAEQILGDLEDFPSEQPEIIRCKYCKYFELNHWDGPIITAHEICSKWGSGCKTDKDGYCFLGERRTDG